MNFKDLSEYVKTDTEKKLLIERVGQIPEFDFLKADYCLSESTISLTKFCPQCGKKYSSHENFCFECVVSLKDIKDVDVKRLNLNPEFSLNKTNSFTTFDEIFSNDNINKINDFKFKSSDLKKIMNNIKLTAFKRFDAAVKENDILLNDLSVLDKIVLFAKSFVDIDYKSNGPELGYYEFNHIFIDDRQTDALQITTILHELSHFLLKEIIAHILCHILECEKTVHIESISTFILSYSSENRLIDEYAAHTVEGRFTLFGYQDYSSFLNIEKSIESSPEEIEMIKTVGNSFASLIKEILESYIDYDLRDEIKTKFGSEIRDLPDYNNLKHETCKILNSKGMIQVIEFLISEGFFAAMDSINTLNEYNNSW